MQVKNTKDENKQTARRTPDSIIIPYRIDGVIHHIYPRCGSAIQGEKNEEQDNVLVYCSNR